MWPKKGKLGINLDTVNCPKCGEEMPKIRTPKNLRQTLWGGWSCNECGRYVSMNIYSTTSVKKGLFRSD